MASYTAYDIAKQIIMIRAIQPIHVSSLGYLPKDVLSALLWLTAEYRNVDDMEGLIRLGADPHEDHVNFTVLEQFVQGHDGYFRTSNSTSDVEEGVKMLSKHGVTRKDLTHDWILSNCESIVNGSEYLRVFFGVNPPERVKVYYHLPRSEKLEQSPQTFKDVEEAVKTLTCLTNYDQYIAVLEYKGNVTRYLVTKGAGPLAIIPMEDKPGWTKKKEMVSNIVNFVMANDEYPLLPCEDDDEDDEEYM
jgi:hypothetical protein